MTTHLAQEAPLKSQRAKQHRQRIQAFQQEVRYSVVASYMQAMRLDYIMFKSELYRIVFSHEREQAIDMIHRIQSQNYTWTIQKYSDIFGREDFADELFTLHNAIVDFGINGLKAAIHDEFDYAKTQFDAMQVATSKILRFIKETVPQV